MNNKLKNIFFYALLLVFVVACDDTVTYSEMKEKDAAIYGLRASGGNPHAAAVEQFYRACRGEEELELSAADVLSTHNLVYALYEEADRRGIHVFGKEETPSATEAPQGERIWYY